MLSSCGDLIVTLDSGDSCRILNILNIAELFALKDDSYDMWIVSQESCYLKFWLSKNILYTLNICNLLYIYFTSIKLFEKPLKIKSI